MADDRWSNPILACTNGKKKGILFRQRNTIKHDRKNNSLKV